LLSICAFAGLRVEPFELLRREDLMALAGICTDSTFELRDTEAFESNLTQ
jgi:hypothetical protein